MKKLPYSNTPIIQTFGDVAGLHLKTSPVTTSVTPSGVQVSAGTSKLKLKVNKQVQELAAQDAAGRTYTATKTPTGYSAGVSGRRGSLHVDTNKNVNINYGNIGVSHSPSGGTGISYKNISAHKLKGGGYSATAHKNINGMDASFTAGNNPQQGRHVQVNLNIPTGKRRNK